MIRTIIDIYSLILIIDVIMSYLPQYKSHPFVYRIKKLSDLTCAPVRKMLPRMDIPFDISPMIVIFALQLVEVLW